MRPNKHFIFTFSALIISLCISCMRTAGTYRWEGNKISPDSYQIKLNADHTYAYYGWSDIMGADTVRGTWKLSRDTLYLSYQKKKKKAFITSIAKKKLRKDSSKITLLDVSDNSFVLGSKVYLNDDDGQFVDSLGSVYKKGNVEKVKVEYLSYLDSVIVQDTNSNHFEIYLDFKANALESFYVSPVWLKKGRRLIQVGTNGNKVKEGIYKKS